MRKTFLALPIAALAAASLARADDLAHPSPFEDLPRCTFGCFLANGPLPDNAPVAGGLVRPNLSTVSSAKASIRTRSARRPPERLTRRVLVSDAQAGHRPSGRVLVVAVPTPPVSERRSVAVPIRSLSPSGPASENVSDETSHIETLPNAWLERVHSTRSASTAVGPFGSLVKAELRGKRSDAKPDG